MTHIKLLITNYDLTNWNFLLTDPNIIIVDDLTKTDIVISLRWTKLSDKIFKAIVLLEEYIPLFRKNTFLDLLIDKSYIPQPYMNCRWFKKPIAESCGRGITIHKTKPDFNSDFVLSPEILTNLTNGFKSDFRLWIGLTSNGDFHICMPIIERRSTIKFDFENLNGALTNIALGGIRIFHSNINFISDVEIIVLDIIKTLGIKQINTKNKSHRFMLTGWDFIIDKNNELKLLEINTCPGMDLCHQPIMNDFINWIYMY